NGDIGFTKLVEGLTLNGQPFLGELLDSEGKFTLYIELIFVIDYIVN
ncbi:unnamed protein product, partial [Rotaria socialis]